MLYGFRVRSTGLPKSIVTRTFSRIASKTLEATLGTTSNSFDPADLRAALLPSPRSYNTYCIANMAKAKSKKASTPSKKDGAVDDDILSPDLELMCVNTIRAVSADQPQAANSGHPGAPMGCAPMAHVLWKDVMNYDSSDPEWINRDRFVLSNGHACALQYTMLHITGYKVSLDDLKNFRRLGSKTPGHPECYETDGMCAFVYCMFMTPFFHPRRNDELT
jgi:hypothetical protein